MRRACSAFHQTFNNCHKKDTLPTFVCPLQSLNYLDNQTTQPTTAEEALDEENEVKNNNQQISTIAEETNAEWSVIRNANGTNICYKIGSSAQVSVIPEN